jgi:hypothetical protein
VLWERERDLCELTGCEAKQGRGKSSIPHLAGGLLASLAVVCPPQNWKPASHPAGTMIESPEERLPVGLPEASN